MNLDDLFLDLFITGPVTTTPESASDGAKARWQPHISPATSLDRFAVGYLFAVLQTYSFVQWRQDPGAHAIHKLVHAWGSDRLALDDQPELSVTILRLLANVVPTCPDLAHLTSLLPHLMKSERCHSGRRPTSQARPLVCRVSG